MKKVLVVAVHPDDETLGCGGTILRLVNEGCEVFWLILTDINESVNFSPLKKEAREREIKEVANLYGFKGVFNLGIEPCTLDQVSKTVLLEKISNVIKQIGPEVIYLPFAFDVHSDHRVAFDALYSCTKTFRYPSIKRIYMMETLSETEFAPSFQATSFIPNSYVNISQYLDLKLQIMKIFKSELGEHPFPRSLEGIRALAVYRGAASGFKYAESFMLLKDII